MMRGGCKRVQMREELPIHMAEAAPVANTSYLMQSYTRRFLLSSSRMKQLRKFYMRATHFDA